MSNETKQHPAPKKFFRVFDAETHAYICDVSGETEDGVTPLHPYDPRIGGSGNVIWQAAPDKLAMNHTQTLMVFQEPIDGGRYAERVAKRANGHPKPQRVFAVKNGSNYEIRPVSSVSRADFEFLSALVDKAEQEVHQQDEAAHHDNR